MASLLPPDGHDSSQDVLPTTLGAFFDVSGYSYRIYDVGRRVMPLPERDFGAFERAEGPYPLPLRRSAWLGVVFWRGDVSPNADPMIWFLKFPLDEQGHLVQASRDYVLRRIFEAYGHHVASRLGGVEGGPSPTDGAALNILEDNPFAFRPAEERLAVFRAKIGVDLGSPPSSYFDGARAYFEGERALSDWQELGLQGIADVAARAEVGLSVAKMSKQIPALPPEPFVALCSCLESEEVTASVAEALAQRGEHALANEEPGPVVAATIRGLSRSPHIAIAASFVDRVLESARANDIEVLAALAGRAWELLHDDRRRATYVERLATCDAGQAGFDAIVTDLLFVPGMRPHLLGTLRSAERSSAVEMRLTALFASVDKEGNA